MPTFRPDLESIPRYIPGKPIDEVARELGISSIDKLASNECPDEPFPEVIAAIGAAARSVNRYPDSAGFDLTQDLARFHGVDPSNVWIGAGSSEILRCTALAVSGPETSAVFASPSFIIYTIVTMIGMGEPIRVPLSDGFQHDLDAMLGSIRDDTTIVYVCNPNNPTGGIRSGAAVRAFIDSVPEAVTIVIDEAYAEYVTDPGYESMLNLAVERPNVLVTRTFSKVYGLAGLRVGYGVGSGELIGSLRITQPPFSVNEPAQVAARVALQHQNRVEERRAQNAVGRDRLTAGLQAHGARVAHSEANFVYFEPSADPKDLSDRLLHHGAIVRVLGPGVRVSVGTPSEVERFANALKTLEVDLA